MRFCITLVLLLTAQAQATTWIEYAHGPDTVYAYAPEYVTRHDNQGKVLVIWSRITQSSAQTTTRYEIHCGSRSTRIIRSSQYRPTSQQETNTPQSRWDYAIPDSVEMAMIDATCPFYQ